jgi:hypothetical protein
MPWDVIWPKESVACIRVTPRPDAELEDNESVNCFTYIYEDRVTHIWEASEYDHPGQEEEDEIARAKIIWERLNPAADWFYCHTDGTRIGDGESIPHHAHIIIGLRDEVDPEWWHKAMSESVSPPSHRVDEDSDYSNPGIAQPECLAPARLAQPGTTAQADGDKDYTLRVGMLSSVLFRGPSPLLTETIHATQSHTCIMDVKSPPGNHMCLTSQTSGNQIWKAFQANSHTATLTAANSKQVPNFRTVPAFPSFQPRILDPYDLSAWHRRGLANPAQRHRLMTERMLIRMETQTICGVS